MDELFKFVETIANYVGYFIGNLGELFELVAEANTYLWGTLALMPPYFMSVIVYVIVVSIFLFIVGRGGQ